MQPVKMTEMEPVIFLLKETVTLIHTPQCCHSEHNRPSLTASIFFVCYCARPAIVLNPSCSCYDSSKQECGFK